MINTTSQHLLDEFKQSYADVIGFAAIKKDDTHPLVVQLLTTKNEYNTEGLSLYLSESITHLQAKNPFSIERYICHLDSDHLEIGLVYKGITFVFLSQKQAINEMLLIEVCLAFCEKVHPSLQKPPQSHSLHSFSRTQEIPPLKPAQAPLPPAKPAEQSTKTTVLRKQAGVRVEKRIKGEHVDVAHYIAQKNLGKFAQQDLLLARSSVLKNLQSQLVLSSFDFQGGQIKIERPFVAGRSMFELIQSRKTMDLPQALAILRKLVELLTPLHENGFAHGNIHPHNVFFSAEREILLTDDYLFDLIASPKFIQKSYAQESRIPVGQLGYLAPEQLLGETASPQSDFWSLGYLFCYLILGEPVMLFRTPSEQIVASHHSLKEAFKERVCRSYPGVENLLYGLLQDKPDKRFQNLNDILGQIVEIMSQHTQG